MDDDPTRARITAFSTRITAAYRGADLTPLAAALAVEIGRWREALAAAHSRAKMGPARAFIDLAFRAQADPAAPNLAIPPELEHEATNASAVIEGADRTAEQIRAHVAHEAAPLALAIAARLVCHAVTLARGQGAELAPVLLDVAERLGAIPTSPAGDAAPIVAAIGDLCARITYARESRTHR